MSITGPQDSPVVLKVQSDPMKKYVLSQLGYPSVDVEITEDQLETAIRVTGDFIAGYFPREQRLAVFNTSPLRSTYPMPSDAYWIQEVAWDAYSGGSVKDIFGIESFLINPGLISNFGTDGLLLDYHLLQSYRRFAGKILGSEGHWEVIGEVDGGGPGDQLIRLYPTPKGVYPVVVVYMPVVNQFRSPIAKMLAHEMLVAEAKCMVGAARRKIAGIPLPDGSSLTLDGDALVTEGREEKERVVEKAILLSEPLGIYKWLFLIASTLSCLMSGIC